MQPNRPMATRIRRMPRSSGPSLAVPGRAGRSVATSDRWAAVRPPGGALEGVRRAQQQALGERLADELEADRHAVAVEADRHADRRQAEVVERPDQGTDRVGEGDEA